MINVVVGPPGCGKTRNMHTLVHHFNAERVFVGGMHMTDRLQGGDLVLVDSIPHDLETKPKGEFELFIHQYSDLAEKLNLK